MTRSKLFQSSVFSGPKCIGNGTSIIIANGPVDLRAAAQLARLLSTPDTGFVWSSGESSTWELVTFSPVELIAFCTQTQLASAYIIRDLSGAEGSVRLHIPQSDRTVEVELPSSQERPFWTRVLRHEIKTAPFTGEILGADLLGSRRADCLIVDTGRSRVLCRIDGAETLARYRCETSCRHGVLRKAPCEWYLLIQ